MAVPSASGSGIVNKPTAYGASSQVTSTNLNAHVDDAVFNANAVDGTTINADSNGKNLFVVDGSISVAKTSFLGTVDTTADSNVKILSKQSDGQYDSVTPSGDVTMSQAGAFTIGAGAVEKSMIENVANNKVLGNVSGGAAAPSELTAANLVTLLGTNLINPTTVATDTKSVTFSNGLIVKFGTFLPNADPFTVNFSDYGGDFTNECFVVLTTPLLDTATNIYVGHVRTKSASSFTYNSIGERLGGANVQFIAIGR